MYTPAARKCTSKPSVLPAFPSCRPLTFWLWSEVKWSEWSEVKWSEVSDPFLVLYFFFNLRYIKGGVRGNNNIGIKKCATNFLWVLNLRQVGGRRKFFQNHTTTVTFWKMVSKVIFWKNFTRDFPVKNEDNFLLEIFT